MTKSRIRNELLNAYIRFQSSTKRSLAFTSLTLGTAVPSEICLTEPGLGKKWYEKILFQVVWKSPQHFESLHRTICNKYWEIMQWTLIHFSFKSRIFCSIFDLISHIRELSRTISSQTFAKISPADLKLHYSRCVSIVFLGKSKCVPNDSCRSKVPARALLNGTIFSLPDYKETDLVHSLR